ncbi:PTS-dependent dihydroxyacetone kinase phosphotransferase subunit DhaM [Proteiniclasticum sp. BAD-10]|uniref:phosphoenolpyruvate--glycerone phosphotransferase n=1 Tax=Proteiniclasticum sediminis TaxID=2804028 RepID=A0A941CS29_9CLOT|nr:dihydroxyacetone kinase phosphoryl donor subunit DhaM [Proteiniclasticum sediminis]MBR0576336.1 PTS-dependent dihydroxyacetone kinase phosphotransferase subunit DhaM [Proteiniclasticum sediminis]
MIGLVLVSHSEKITDGLRELILEMTQEAVPIISAGGTSDGRLGTSAEKIVEAINELSSCNNILIFTDIGSSIMSSEIALEMVDSDLREKCLLVDAPIVEGAFVAGVQAMVSEDVDAVLEEVKLTKQSKL